MFFRPRFNHVGNCFVHFLKSNPDQPVSFRSWYRISRLGNDYIVVKLFYFQFLHYPDFSFFYLLALSDEINFQWYRLCKLRAMHISRSRTFVHKLALQTRYYYCTFVTAWDTSVTIKKTFCRFCSSQVKELNAYPVHTLIKKTREKVRKTVLSFSSNTPTYCIYKKIT